MSKYAIWIAAASMVVNAATLLVVISLALSLSAVADELAQVQSEFRSAGLETIGVPHRTLREVVNQIFSDTQRLTP